MKVYSTLLALRCCKTHRFPACPYPNQAITYIEKRPCLCSIRTSFNISTHNASHPAIFPPLLPPGWCPLSSRSCARRPLLSQPPFQTHQPNNRQQPSLETSRPHHRRRNRHGQPPTRRPSAGHKSNKRRLCRSLRADELRNNNRNRPSQQRRLCKVLQPGR